jgi:two-component system, cell cycle sensor histidine kinase and response regulator CckA
LATQPPQEGDHTISARTVSPSAGHKPLDAAAAAALSALRESEERFRAVFENAGIGMALGNLQGQTLATNAALQRMLGYGADELLRMPLPLADSQDTAEDLRLMHEVVRREREYYQLEKRYVRRDGSILWGRLTVSMIFSAAGEPRFAVGMVEDITDQKRTLEALGASNERYRRLVEMSPDAVLVHIGGTIAFSNGVGARMLGADGEEALIGRSIDEFVPADAPGALRSLLLAAGSADVLSPFMGCTLRRPDGSELPCEVAASPFLADGDAAVQVIIRDLTERKRAADALARSEAQLQHSQKMEAVGRLAGGVAHDFNNLLTAILGHAHVLLDGLHDTPAMRDDADAIRAAAERAASLTRQLLAFSRKQRMLPRTVDANVVVRELQPMLTRLIGEDVKLTTALTDAPCWVSVDPSQLEQVIVNLAVNARDALGTGGGVEIVTGIASRIDAGDGAADDGIAGEHVLLSVRDNGCGIPETVLPHIFEPFFTTKPTGQGTGLGLPTVYGIVRQSGGNVTIESEVGRGTCVHLRLPITAPPADTTDTGAVQPGARSGGETILLAEDEDGVRRLAGRVLRAHGYNVLEANGGASALEILRQHQGIIDLLVADVIMPDLTGPSLAAAVRAQRPTIRTLFVSGYTQDIMTQRGELPADEELLEKPFTPDQLASRVRRILDAA